MPPALPGFARRESGRVVFRDGPATLPVTLDSLHSSDDHDVTLHVRVSVRPVDRPADVQLFAEQFLSGRDAVAVDDLAGHFRGALSAIATEWVSTHPAADVVDRPADLAAHLRKQADAAAFGCGIEIVHPWQVSADSPSLRRERDREQARRRALADAEHAAKLAESLAGAPVDRLPASEQAALLPMLLAARPAVDLLLSAGPNLVIVDPANDLRVIAAPPEVGPLRCVRQAENGAILVGGTTGVAVLSDSSEVVRVVTGGGSSGRGFNAVAQTETQLLATHGEIGLTAWDAAGVACVYATPGAARGLTTVAGKIWLAAGKTVCRFDGDGVVPVLDGDSNVLALLSLGERVVAIRADGVVQTIDPSTAQVVAEFRYPLSVSAAAAVDAGLWQAVAVAGDRGSVDAVSVDGRPLGNLSPRLQGVRMIAVVGSRLAAVTADRTSVVLMSAGSYEPPVTINILARTGYHVTDIHSSQWKL